MTEIVDVDPRELPRVSARDAASLTRAARVLAALPRRLEAGLGDLGSVVLACEGLEALGATAAGESTGEVTLGLTRAAGVGRIVIDGGLARRLIAVALGGVVCPDAPLARFGPGERGIVAGLVASVLHALRAPFSVSLVAPGSGAVAGEGGVAVALAVTVADAAGWARLEIPSGWLPATPLAPGDALAALEVEARVELARTELSAGELARVVAGDAIVFDGARAFAWDAAERPVRVVIGAHAARARLSRDALSEDGRVTLEDALSSVPWAAPAPSRFAGHEDPREVTLNKPNKTDQTDTTDTSGPLTAYARAEETGTRPVDVAAVLASTPIEVVAELGRLMLRGAEVAGLGPGAVLTLGRVGASPVALRVGGEIWAEGELVDVEGELGVRVTSTRRSGLP